MMNLERTVTESLPTERLFALMETKLRLLEHLHVLAQEQSEIAARRDMQEWMSLLARKQSVVERLLKLQAEFAPFADQDPETRPWNSHQRRRECQDLQARCEQRVQELLVLENRAIEDLASQRELLGSHLQQTADALRLTRAYSNPWDDDHDGRPSMSFTG